MLDRNVNISVSCTAKIVADHTLRIDADAHFVSLRDDDTQELFVYVHAFS